MIALATCSALPELDEDDRPLLDAFRAAGLRAGPVIWDQDRVRWASYQAVIVRNTWDYVEKATAFREWLAALDALGLPVWNPVPVMIDNLDKTYLRSWEIRGVPVVPTVWIEHGTLAAHLDSLVGEQWVLKPSVSAGARQTYRFARSEADRYENALADILTGSTAMLQPYLPEVAREGEWSFIFFDGEFSHAVLKKPAAGDFRAQEHFGGEYSRQKVPGELIAQARRALGVVGSRCLYARVDMVPRGDELLLSELELTEPSLYLRQDPRAAERFVAAYRRLSESGKGAR